MNKVKFDKIAEAAAYINDRLVKKGFIKSNEKLLFNSVNYEVLVSNDKPNVDDTNGVNGENPRHHSVESDSKNEMPSAGLISMSMINNDKLVINTMHKLLKALEKTEERCQLVHKSVPSDVAPIKESPPAPERIRTAPYRISKPIVTKVPAPPLPKSKDKSQLVQLRRYKIMVEQLRLQLHGKANKSDVTWSSSSAIMGSANNEAQTKADNASDLLRKLIQENSVNNRVMYHLYLFLELVNKYVYSKFVLQIDCDTPERIPLDRETTSTTTTQELQELVNDFYEIIDLL